MEITTRISSHAAPERPHYGECTRDHPVSIVIFTSATPAGGYGQDTASNCMFFEMEDAAHASMMDAVDTSEDYPVVDEDDLWAIATDVASVADGVDPGEATHVRNKVETF